MRRILAGAACAFLSSAACAAVVTIVPDVVGVPAGGSFSLTIHADLFPETAGATLGLVITRPDVTYVSGWLPSRGPFSLGAFYLPHPSVGTPSTFDILAPSTGTPPSGSFDALILNFAVSPTGTGITPENPNLGVVFVDNQDTLAWFDATTFEPIPVIYNGAVIPLPAGAWLVVPAVLSATRFARRRPLRT